METFGIAILIVVLIVSPIIILLVRKAVATIQMYAVNLAHKARELKREKRKSDSLLFQMLPPTVATQLKQAQTVPAEYYSAVTIFFSDIVGFTEIAAECTPLEVGVSFVECYSKCTTLFVLANHCFMLCLNKIIQFLGRSTFVFQYRSQETAKKNILDGINN